MSKTSPIRLSPKGKSLPLDSANSATTTGAEGALLFQQVLKQTEEPPRAQSPEKRAIARSLPLQPRKGGISLGFQAKGEASAGQAAAPKPGVARTTRETMNLGAGTPQAASAANAPSKSPQTLEPGIDLNGKNLSRRAGGGPLVRDRSGQAYVAGQPGTDLDVSDFLARSADAGETERARQTMQNLISAAQKEPSTSAEAVERAGTKVLEGTADRAAVNSDQKVKEGVGRLKTKEEPTHTSPEGRSEVKTELTPEKTVRSAGADNRLEAVRSSTAGPSERALSAGGRTPSLGLDAHPVATALSNGDPVLATRHLSELLNARIDFIANQARPEVMLKLSPESLGAIHVRLVAVGERTDVRLRAEEESVSQLLETAAPDLARQLAKAGIEVGRITVDNSAHLSTQDPGQDRAQSQRQGRESSSGDALNEFLSAAETPEAAKPAVSSRPPLSELDVTA